MKEHESIAAGAARRRRERRLRSWLKHERMTVAMVVVGVPSTQRSDLLGDCLGKPGASQGSPLRVAPGVCRCSVSGPMMGDTPSGVVALRA